MATINGRSISRAKLSDLVNLNPETLAKLTKKESRSLEKRLHKEVERRLKVIEKHGLSSYAADKYFGGDVPTLSSATTKRQGIQHNIVSMQTFLSSKSSSYTGIKQIWKDEEKRIFGKEGGFKSEDERKRFWAAYTEFQHQNPALLYGQGASTRLQQFLGRETFWRQRGFTADDLENLYSKMMNFATGGVDIRARAGRDLEI